MVISITLVLVVLIIMQLHLHHFAKLLRAICKVLLMSSVVLPYTYNVVLSAYMSLLDEVVYNGRSLINIKNRSEPKMEPCGIPSIMNSSSEVVLFKDTFCFLLFRYEENQDTVLLVNL